MSQAEIGLASHFAQYTAELRDCAATRGIRCGSPAALAEFVLQLSQPGSLPKEIAALLRATIFREQEQIGPGELVTLLGEAIGGPQVDLDEPSMARVRGELERFVARVSSHLWSRFPEESLAGSPGKDVPAAVDLDRRSPAAPSPMHPVEEIVLHQEQPPLQPAAADGLPAAHFTAGELHHLRVGRSGLFPGGTPEAGAEPALRPERTEQTPPVRKPEAAEDTVPAGVFASVRRLWRDPDPGNNEDGLYPEYSSFRMFAPEHRRLWALGSGGLLFGMALGIALWHTPSRTAPTAASTTLPDQATVAGGPVPDEAPGQAGSGLVAASQAPAAGSGSTSPELGVTGTFNGSTDSAGPDEAALSGAPQAEGGQPVTRQDWDQALGVRSARGPGGTDLPAAVPRQRARSIQVPETQATFDQPQSESDGSVSLSVSGPGTENLQSAPLPAYPHAARTAGVQGAVVIQAVVGLQGTVLATRVLSGPASLRAAAQNAVREWRFHPYMVGGLPSMFTTEAVLNFRR